MIPLLLRDQDLDVWPQLDSLLMTHRFYWDLFQLIPWLAELPLLRSSSGYGLQIMRLGYTKVAAYLHDRRLRGFFCGVH